MYDDTMPDHAIDPAIHAFARRRAMKIIEGAGPFLVERMGGEERIVRSCLRDASKARDALTLPPGERLRRTVDHWAGILRAAEGTAPQTVELDEDTAVQLELDDILRTRIDEIQAALDGGDVPGAFTLLRNMTVARDGEGQPVAVAVPDSLDPDSAYWIDLDRNRDN